MSVFNMTNHLELGITPFKIPLPGRKPNDFDFTQDFGRKTGEKLMTRLGEMFEIPKAVSQENIIYTIPIEKTLFPKRKRPKKQINSTNRELDFSIKSHLNRFGNIEEVTYTDIIISEIVEDLALYTLAFGEYPLPEEVKARIVKSIELNLGWHKSPSANIASMHLILGGKPLWTPQQSSDMLKGLKGRLIDGFDKYELTHTFDKDFARTALAYKVLSEHID